MNKMYHVAYRLKQKGDGPFGSGPTVHKLATTVKCMMVTAYGSSFTKPKSFSNKYTTNVGKRIEEFAPYVAKYKLNGPSGLSSFAATEDGQSGYVATINSFRPHFNHVQFTKLILDNYQNKVKELEGIVNILYYNVDSFLVNELDFMALEEAGFVGEDMGKLKIVEVFEEVIFERPRKWMARCEDGSYYARPKKLLETTTFEQFRNRVMNQ
jgi:hypothetical protein